MKKCLLIVVMIVVAVVFGILAFRQFKTNNIVSNKIIEKIDMENKCEVVIRDLTDFQWDTLIVCTAVLDANEISSLMGEKCSSKFNLDSVMFFLKNDKVVHKEIYKANVERPEKFNLWAGSGRIVKFTPESAIFIGYKENNSYFLDLRKALKYHGSQVLASAFTSENGVGFSGQVAS